MFSKAAAYISHPFLLTRRRVYLEPSVCSPKDALSSSSLCFRRLAHPVRCQLKFPNDKDSDFSELKSDIQEYLRTCPQSDSNPLTYVNLGIAGRADLISRIMDNGGYIQVSQRLGIPVQESDFIPPPPVLNPIQLSTKNSSEGAALAIGRDLEARLDSLEDVLEDIAQTSNAHATSSAATSNRAPADDVPTAEQLLLENERLVPPVVDQRVPEGERFVLPAGMRIGMLGWLVAISIGFGRTSQHLMPQTTITASQSVAGVLTVAHFVLGAYVGVVLAPQLRRNPALWFVKVLLAGPVGLRYLRALGSL